MPKRKKRRVDTESGETNSNSNDDNEDICEGEAQFWAEAILDWGLHDNSVMMYLVKWEGYSKDENSWEFQQHVGKCSDLLLDFHTKTVNGRHPPKWSFDEFDKLHKYLAELIQRPDLAVFRKFKENSKKANKCFVTKTEEIDEMNDFLKSQLNLFSQILSNLNIRTNGKRLELIEVIKKVIKKLKIEKNFGSTSDFFEFVDRRHETIKDLEKWRNEINEIILKDSEGKPIRISNDVDFEVPKLQYITDYIIDVQFENKIKLEDEKPLVGCQCVNCFESQDECCTAIVGFPMAYNSRGLLTTKRFNTVIYECNSECLCSQECPNRQIQRGRLFDLEIFRHRSKTKGWGVRALQTIPKGSFIAQYTGEVISIIEAEKRPSTFLFDLSAHLHSTEAEYTYIVDASNYGNITRFINHSCSPNCRVLFAWVNRSFDKLLPIIALFAIQDIEPNEELNYDYSTELLDSYNQNTGLKSHKELIGCSKDIDSEDTSQKRAKPRQMAFTRIECECGADNCRNFLYS